MALTDGGSPAGAPGTSAGGRVRGVVYADLLGEVVVGDRVLLNCNALAKDLGTGGLALVVAVLGRLPDVAPTEVGHLVKARYTPLQAVVLGADEQDSPHHAVLEEADNIDGMPVVAADLHSSLPAILAGLRASNPGARAVYVMTDGGALPAAFSRTAAQLREHGWLEAVVTTGQSYGGDFEAVTVHTGLLTARLVADADVAIVTQGPGNLGTGTRWGFSGVAAGEALNAAAVVGGHGIATLRVSGADPRARHRGISHHSLTAYGRVLARFADLPVPDLRGQPGVPDELAEMVTVQAAELVGDAPQLRRHEVDPAGLMEALRDCPVRLSTMGRGLEDDPAAFLAAAAAGRHAAAVLDRIDLRG
ncbi:uncharacterized protein DUF3866 [Ornithinicoccus hortensis]|uniref:Uncharacterized protein DUF3866 n=1 Tax=Ornithinicoccus hortensis TaxID=82346 RepID=A0A542YSZ5_9MICO|nr:uncharacterized protein DUF3866 [Ornithinicoccus hortensis]